MNVEMMLKNSIIELLSFSHEIHEPNPNNHNKGENIESYFPFSFILTHHPNQQTG
jgi:hypothetical protein